MIQCFAATSSLTVKKTDDICARGLATGAGGLATGAVVGIASATFLLGLVVAAVVLSVLRYVGVCYLLFKHYKHRINHFRCIFKTRTETLRLVVVR